MNRCTLFGVLCLMSPAVRTYGYPSIDHTQSLQPDSILTTAVVTGTRTPKRLADTPIRTIVLSREDIRRSDAGELQDLLVRELPGLEFTYALNGQPNLNMAGFSGQSILILINGERMAGETMDNVDFSRISMNDVERIEIVRGAASTLYGSNASGGVVNVITRQQIDRPWEAHAEARIARHAVWRQNLNAASQHGALTQLLNIHHTSSETYTLSNPADVAQFTKYALNRIAGGRTWQVKERLVYRPKDNLRFTGVGNYFFRERHYDPGEHNRYRDATGTIKAEWQPNTHSHAEAAYHFDQYDKSNFYTSTVLDLRTYSNVRHSLRALFTQSRAMPNGIAGEMTFTLGGDFLRDQLLSYQFKGETHRQYSTDAFAQADWIISPQWELLLAGRYDYFSVGSECRPTAQLSTRYQRGALTLRAGYSQGFRAPTLKEKFMNFFINDIFIIRGHHDLRPEQSHNFRLSADYTGSASLLSIASSYSRVAHRITTAAPTEERDVESGLPFVDYMNVPRLTVLGLELSAARHWRLWEGKFTASCNYAFTHEEVQALGTLTPYLPARPHSATARLTFDRRCSQHYAWGVQLDARALSQLHGKEYNTSTGTSQPILYPAYVLLRLTSSQQIGRGVCFRLSADNLLNYRPHIYYYNAPPTDGIDLSMGLTLDLERLF